MKKVQVKKTNYLLTGIVSLLLILETVDFENFPTLRYRNSEVNQVLVIAYLNSISLSLGITLDLGNEEK